MSDILLRKVLYCPCCGRTYGHFKRLPPRRTCRDVYCPLFNLPRQLVLGEMADADREAAKWRPKRQAIAEAGK